MTLTEMVGDFSVFFMIEMAFGRVHESPKISTVSIIVSFQKGNRPSTKLLHKTREKRKNEAKKGDNVQLKIEKLDKGNENSDENRDEKVHFERNYYKSLAKAKDYSGMANATLVMAVTETAVLYQRMPRKSKSKLTYTQGIDGKGTKRRRVDGQRPSTTPQATNNSTQQTDTSINDNSNTNRIAVILDLHEPPREHVTVNQPRNLTAPGCSNWSDRPVIEIGVDEIKVDGNTTVQNISQNLSEQVEIDENVSMLVDVAETIWDFEQHINEEQQQELDRKNTERAAIIAEIDAIS
ncbi:hypothetical protein FQA39_LY06409 [Lamprigera yunnana]|nr:hypothetical protein FQA39_LY06409 [Lamprigera yunnana]